jgi:hypothetical protein
MLQQQLCLLFLKVYRMFSIFKESLLGKGVFILANCKKYTYTTEKKSRSSQKRKALYFDKESLNYTDPFLMQNNFSYIYFFSYIKY